MKPSFRWLLLFLIPLLLVGCARGPLAGPKLQITPALTPIFADQVSTTPTPTLPGQARVSPVPVIVGNTTQARRTPIVIHVPTSPAQSVSIAPAGSDMAQNPAPAAAQATPEVTAASPPAAPPSPLPPPAETPAPQAEEEETGYQGVPVSLDDTLNILVVGSDERRPGQPWRSDVIMVVAVDQIHGQIGVISFPRDLYVDIPTVGKNRINTATFFGGVNRYPNGGDIGLLKDTLAQNFGIRIDHYVKFNFETFKDVIDALGGVDVVVDCPITGKFPVEPGSKQLKWQTLQPGKYHMDGEFALRYVRERKTTSDVDRNRRQQRVLIAMRKRAQEVNIIPRIPALYQAMRDNIETDLSLTDILALARLGLQIDPKDVHGFNISYKEVHSWTTPGGAAVLLPDMEKINQGIQTLFSKPSILKNPQKPRNCR